MPIRIQRKRERGWKMPENSIYVGRPTKWGNPFWHAQRFCGDEMALRLYRELVSGFWTPQNFKDLPDGPFQIAYRDWFDWRKKWARSEYIDEMIRRELRGKDLACWCRLDSLCHADILLEIANS